METIDSTDLLRTALNQIHREFPGMFGREALLEASIELEKARAMAYAARRGL